MALQGSSHPSHLLALPLCALTTLTLGRNWTRAGGQHTCGLRGNAGVKPDKVWRRATRLGETKEPLTEVCRALTTQLITPSPQSPSRRLFWRKGVSAPAAALSAP